MSEIRHPEAKTTMSCFAWTLHVAHNWERPGIKLWCPGRWKREPTFRPEGRP